MNDFKEIEIGCIKMIHHSTSSFYEVRIKFDDEVSQGVFEPNVKILCLDYKEFSDLKNAFKLASDF